MFLKIKMKLYFLNILWLITTIMSLSSPVVELIHIHRTKNVRGISIKSKFLRLVNIFLLAILYIFEAESIFFPIIAFSLFGLCSLTIFFIIKYRD